MATDLIHTSVQGIFPLYKGSPLSSNGYPVCTLNGCRTVVLSGNPLSGLMYFEGKRKSFFSFYMRLGFQLLDECIPLMSRKTERRSHSLLHIEQSTFLRTQVVLIDFWIFKYLLYGKCFLDPLEYRGLRDIVRSKFFLDMPIRNMYSIVFLKREEPRELGSRKSSSSNLRFFLIHDFYRNTRRNIGKEFSISWINIFSHTLSHKDEFKSSSRSLGKKARKYTDQFICLIFFTSSNQIHKLIHHDKDRLHVRIRMIFPVLMEV